MSQAKLQRYASLEDAAAYLGCNTRTIRRQIAAGHLTGYRFGSRIIRVDLAELDQLLRPIPTVRPTGDGDRLHEHGSAKSVPRPGSTLHQTREPQSNRAH